MRRVLLAATTILALGLLAVPAGAAEPSCESEAIRIAFTHPRVWRKAGNPTVVCGAVLPTARVEAGAYYDLRANTIYLRDGLPAYNRPVAHELGHAWLYHRTDPRRVEKYAAVRGFPEAYTVEVNEDFAEVFAFVLGEWADIATPAPYGFQTEAGLPTPKQIARLRRAGVLPRTSA